MSNKKQSSIDWLEEEFVKLEATVGVHSVMYELIDKAKAMHKDEIETAYWEGGQDVPMTSKRCEEYYNETFGKDE